MPPRKDAASSEALEYTYFPPCKPAEIVEVVQDLELHCTVEDLAKPTGPAMQRIYAAFMTALTGVDLDALERPKQAALGMLEYRELYDDPIMFIMFFNELQRIFRHSGVEDFTVRDLTRPDPKRTRRLLSALVNFYRFRHDRVIEFEALTKEMEDNEETRLRLLEENERLRNAIEMHMQRRQREEPLVKETKLKNQETNERLLGLRKVQSGLMDELEKLKKEKNEILEKSTNLQYVIQTTAAELARLRSRMVTSPQKIKQGNADRHAHLNDERNSLSMLERQAKSLQHRLDMMEEVITDVQGCIKLLEEVELECAKLAASQTRLGETQEQIQARLNESAELASKASQLERKMNATADRLARLQSAMETKRRDARERQERLTEEYRKLKSEKQERDRETEEQKKLVQDLETKIEGIRNDFDNYLAGLEQSATLLRAQTETYVRQMQKSLGLDMPST